MKTFLFAFFLFAAPAFACQVDSFEVVPRRPTSDDAIEIRLAGGCPDGCVPINERVRVEPGRIRIDYDSPDGCILVPTRWSRRVELGRVPGGTYEVVVTYRDRQMSRQTLTVRDVGTQRFQVIPSVGREHTRIWIAGLPECAGGRCAVVIGGANATILEATPDALVVAAPAHADGVVDVVVQTPSGLLTAVGAFEYTRTFDARDYARILFPVVYDGPGANGSRWTSSNVVYNAAPIALETIPSISVPGVITTPTPGPIPTRESASIGTRNTDGGFLLLVPRQLLPYVRTSSHIRDLSRAAESRGTELRVIREDDTASELHIISIPADPLFRPRLRVYDIDGNEEQVVVTMRRPSGAHLTTTVVRPRRSFVCITTPCEDASFVALDLSPMFAGLAASEIVHLKIETANERRLWAFVSVTNNETQQVTTYSPQ